TMREELGITRLMLFEHHAEWDLILAYGAGGAPDAAVMEVFGEYKDIQVIGSEHSGSLGAFDVAVPVHHREKTLALLLIGDIDEEEQRISPAVKHLNFIQTLTNLIVVAMENQRLAKQALQQERAKRELELAAEMQSMLVPKDLPRNERVEAAGWYQPHSEVGGDYYDLIALAPDRYVVCVADVSGKGIAAALLMSNFQANLHASVMHATDLGDMVHDLNGKVFRNARGERFITLFVGIIDLAQRKVRYVNAGHNDPMLHAEGRSIALHDGCIALGMMPKLPFLRTGEVDLPTDATLLCYTDGLVEQEDAAGNDLGVKVIADLMKEHAGRGPVAVNEALIAAFEEHRLGQPYLDDIALLTCRFK
ncbi:MAG: serine/threonine-protein phosphatase, partial [Flavobacteriales bacterium]|nr:serine/threonine-protein phosphatase [Flavobacteriales bacterium]